MTAPELASHQAELDSAAWRKSSFSGDPGACVEVASMPDSRIAVRHTNHPGSGTIFFTRTEINAWLKGVKAGEFDDLGPQR
nr:DUF397 domain-containing protein [Streptomyces anulatus]